MFVPHKLILTRDRASEKKKQLNQSREATLLFTSRIHTKSPHTHMAHTPKNHTKLFKQSVQIMHNYCVIIANSFEWLSLHVASRHEDTLDPLQTCLATRKQNMHEYLALSSSSSSNEMKNHNNNKQK